jgi:Mce-associated membrane protein
LTTYSYRTAEEDFAWVQNAATERFQRSFDSANAIEEVRSLKAIAVGEVVDSAASAADAEHVKVLLFVDQSIRSAGRPGAVSEQTRVTVQMVHDEGRWLMDELQITNLLAPRD